MEYNIVIAKSATHDLKISQINWENGKMESYKFLTNEIKPLQSISFDELQFDIKTKRAIVKNVTGAVTK